MAGLFELLAGEFGIISFVRENLALDVAASDILAKAAEEFTTIPASKVSNIINYFQTQLPAALNYVTSLNRDELPDINQLLPPTTNQLLNFSYVVQVNGLLPGTSQTLPQFVTVISNSLLTKRAAAQIAFSKVASNTSASYDISPVNADVLSITYKGGGTPDQIYGLGITEGFGHGI